MKLVQPKEWFEDCLPHEDVEVSAGRPTPAESESQAASIEIVMNVRFGELVRELRQAQQLSIEQLAAQTEVTPSELHCLEADPSHHASTQTIEQLCKFFGLSQQEQMKVV